jgi:hypothetical protein
MAEEVHIPRSGLWNLHSKKDRRWNLQGQYSSMEWGPSPTSLPVEARQALEELTASLGEDPPDDVRFIFRPYPTPRLRRLFDANAFLATEKQGALFVLTQEKGLSQLNMDLARGELSFSKPGQEPTHHFPAQFIGLLDQEHTYWQWGWVSAEKGSMSPLVLKSAFEIREFGQQQEIPELTYAEIALGRGDDRPWFNGDYLAMVACHLCKADFSVAAPAPDAPGLVMYWIVTAPDVLPKPSNESARMGLVIREAMANWASALQDSDGREIVRSYAALKNCTVTEESDRRLRIDAPSGDHIFIDFEESGGIYGIEFPPVPKPESTKVSWFKKLLGGREARKR